MPLQVFQAVWWMGHYGSLTMKRHIAWSNCRTVNCLDLGIMAKEYQEKHFRHGAKSARTYTNKSGRKAYHGTKFLKRTGIPCQLLIMIFLFVLSCILGCYWGNFGKQCLPGPERHLRTYPPKFGKRMVQLFPRFIAKKEALPEISFTEPIQDGFWVFSQMAWDDWWDCANMKSVFAYLRGSTDLELGEWRNHLPTHI